MSDYTHVVLITGEELIGRIVHEDDNMIVLDDALTMYYTAPDPSSPGISVIFRKYSLISDEYHVSFLRNHVLSVCRNLKPDVIDGYEQSLALSKREDDETLDDDFEGEPEGIDINKRTVH